MAFALNSRRAFLLSLIVLGGAFALRAFREENAGRPPDPRSAFSRFPFEIRGWSGRDIPISDRQMEALDPSAILFRQYRKGESVVNLYLLGGSGDRAAFHPPEYCYVGGRAEMVESGVRKLPWGGKSVPGRRLLIHGPFGKSLVYYWYAVGDRFTDNYYRQQLLVIADRLRGRPRPSFLIRVSVEGEFEVEPGDGAALRFVREVFPELERYLLDWNSGAATSRPW